jgi:hypothetical protein
MTKVCCDGCFAELSTDASPAAMQIDVDWGFGSGRDGEHTHIDLCEDCFEKVEEFLASLRKQAGTRPFQNSL